MELRKSLGYRIRLFRKAKKLTQERLAELTELSVTFIGTTERGENCPSLKTCHKIAESLGIPLSELFVFQDGGEKEKRISRFCSELRDVDEETAELVMEVGKTILGKNKK
jgi:transcriptional regulator with XRE-family HTH domain